MAGDPGFKGYIHNVGGLTANYRVPACEKQLKHDATPNKCCLSPDLCQYLHTTHEDHLTLLNELRAMKRSTAPRIRTIRRSSVRLSSTETSKTTIWYARRCPKRTAPTSSDMRRNVWCASKNKTKPQQRK